MSTPSGFTTKQVIAFLFVLVSFFDSYDDYFPKPPERPRTFQWIRMMAVLLAATVALMNVHVVPKSLSAFGFMAVKVLVILDSYEEANSPHGLAHIILCILLLQGLYWSLVPLKKGTEPASEASVMDVVSSMLPSQISRYL